jgi:hypothetical protein
MIKRRDVAFHIAAYATGVPTHPVGSHRHHFRNSANNARSDESGLRPSK